MSQSASSGVIGYYERGADGTLVSKIASDGSEFYYVMGGVGSVIALVDTGSDTVASYAYDPYGGHGRIGHPDAPDNSVGEANPYRFAGGYRDTATGLVKFGDRFYDANLGRWTQVDPIDHLLNLKEGNPYSYAGNDPVNGNDPSGRGLFGDILIGTAAALAVAAPFTAEAEPILGAAATVSELIGAKANGASGDELLAIGAIDVATLGVGAADANAIEAGGLSSGAGKGISEAFNVGGATTNYCGVEEECGGGE